MNRRNFFKLAASFVAGGAMGVHAYAKDRFAINPAWRDAPIEVEFIFAPLPEHLRHKIIPIIYQRNIPAQRYAWRQEGYEKV